MSVPFLKQVADHILIRHKDKLESCCIVLPNKRAALYLKQHLAASPSETMWMPAIKSAEEFFTELSGVDVPEEMDLLCLLYSSYRGLKGEEAENFDGFSKWARQVIQDFNEVDRYLADPHQLYENLRYIREIENWSLSESALSPYQQDYLEFMATLGALYKTFRESLLLQKKAWQGLMYRLASENFEFSSLLADYERFIFCGFNALNAAEEKIIRALYSRNKAEMLWDVDDYYLHREEQEAGQFLRKFIRLMPDARQVAAEEHFRENKVIEVISVTGVLGQAMVMKQKLEDLLRKGVSPDKIAVVMANENLLWPVLQQLPDNIGAVNITMEYPLRLSPTYSLLESLLNIQYGHAKRPDRRPYIYYKDLIAVLQEPLFQMFLLANHLPLDVSAILNSLRKRNLVFLNESLQKELFGESYSQLKNFFAPADQYRNFTGHLLSFFESLHGYSSQAPASPSLLLERECLHVLLNQLNRVIELLDNYPYFTSFNAFRQLLLKVLSSASVPFSGEPLSGLQIMGILESRTLDFDHLILLTINEGVLPSGRSNASFLPNDLKRAFGLPLYSDKDAIYAYHFYRLLQRSRSACLVYDSISDTFGKGEKSRFITQLMMELPHYHAGHEIRDYSASYPELPSEKERKIEIQKTEERLERILHYSLGSEQYRGLSPSALIAFKECSLRFYFRYGVGLKEQEDVEEYAESNTMGSILHLGLENLYRELCGIPMSPDLLEKKKSMVETLVRQSFLNFFDVSNLSGKNILQEEVLKVYLNRQLDQDLKWLKENLAQKKTCKILHLEHELKASLPVQLAGKTLEIVIKGKADRIDLCGRQLRVVDYKSSVSSKDDFNFKGFDHLFGDASTNKQLQLMLYAWLSFKSGLAEPEDIRPCLLAFKGGEDAPIYLNRDKQTLVFTRDFFSEFEKELSGFMARIFDTDEAFKQTVDEDACEYCAYQALCLRG